MIRYIHISIQICVYDHSFVYAEKIARKICRKIYKLLGLQNMAMSSALSSAI